jgi:TonB family protein
MLRALVLFVAILPVFAQEWTPKRIVAIMEYPPLPKEARIAGVVEIRCFLDANGTVTRAEAISGHPLFKEQARQNALLWKFQRTGPGESNTITLTYQFRLEGEPQDQTVFVVDLPSTVQIIAPKPFPTMR